MGKKSTAARSTPYSRRLRTLGLGCIALVAVAVGAAYLLLPKQAVAPPMAHGGGRLAALKEVRTASQADDDEDLPLALLAVPPPRPPAPPPPLPQSPPPPLPELPPSVPEPPAPATPPPAFPPRPALPASPGTPPPNPPHPPKLPPLPYSPPSPPMPPRAPPPHPPLPKLPHSPPPLQPPPEPPVSPPACAPLSTPNKAGHQYVCTCMDGFRGDPYDSGPQKCRDQEQLYLEELFGMNKCYGCRYEPALYGTYESVNITRVLDVGTGACGVVRRFINHGMDVQGVEAVSFPLEDRCADLLQSGVVQKAPLDALPFDDSEFQLVTAFNVLEYIPTDKLDLVLDEMGRVAQSRMVVAVQLPDYESTRGLNPDSILQPESFFPRSWWQERLEAHGFHVSTVRMAMYALQFEHTKSTKKKLSDVDGLFLLTKVPANPFAAARATQAEVCVSCAYMPLVYSIYAPQSGRALPGSKMHMTHTAVVSPSACSLVRGMDLSPPKGLKKLKGVARNEYLVEMGCPDLQDQGKLTFSNPEREEELPFATASFDVVLSMHDLEYLPEKLVGAAMEELARVTTAHVLAVVNVCGNKYTTPHCPAAGLVGLQTLKSRAWWVEKFAKHGLSLHPVSGVFERRPCDAEGKAVHPTTVDDGWSIADATKAKNPWHHLKRANDPLRKMCDSRFVELRREAEHELILENIFILKRQKPQPRYVKLDSQPPPPLDSSVAHAGLTTTELLNADALPDQVAAEVFGWNAEAGDATGSTWAEEAVPPPPFVWSEEALEDQLEQELAALDAAGGGTVQKPAVRAAPPPRSLVDKYAAAGYNVRAALPISASQQRAIDAMKRAQTRPRMSTAAAFHSQSQQAHAETLEQKKAVLSARLAEERAAAAARRWTDDPANAAAAARKAREDHAAGQAAFEAEHGIDRASLRDSQEAAMAARLAQLEEDAYNIKVHTRRQPGDHPDPSLHLHQTEDGQWERQVTLDSLARKYKNALPRTMATQQNLVEDLHLLKKSIGHEQGEAAKQQWMRESIGHHSAQHLNDNPIPKVRDEVSIKTLEAEFGKIPGMKHLTSGRK